MSAAAVIAAAFVAGAASAETTGVPVADFTLPNGLELIVIPDHRAPVVTHMIWYKVGAADETPGKSGLAHFLEHLMFKGTAKNPAGQFSQVVARFGGQENAFTSNDYTAFYQRVPSDQLKTVMDFEADRMTGLQLTDQVVLPEREVILEEQNQRVGNNPRARLSEQIDAALFLNHPYGKPVIGWRHEMEQLSRDDAIGFYRRFYAPNDAVVIVAGDVDPAEALQIRRSDLRQGRASRQYPTARAPAGTAAGGGALADAGRSARRTADDAARLSGAVGPYRQAGTIGSARCARAYSGRRLQQPALPRFGGGQARRGQRRRLVRQFRSRHGEVRRLCRAAAGRHAAADRSRRRCGAGRRCRQGRVGRGAGALEIPHDRRRGLCAGQPGQHGALVRHRR